MATRFRNGDPGRCQHPRRGSSPLPCPVRAAAWLLAVILVITTTVAHGGGSKEEKGHAINKQLQDQKHAESHGAPALHTGGHNNSTAHTKHGKNVHSKSDASADTDGTSHPKATAAKGESHLQLAQESQGRASSQPIKPAAKNSREHKGSTKTRKTSSETSYRNEIDRSVELVWDRIRGDPGIGDQRTPRNVSGTYRGTWSKVRYDEGLQSIRLLTKQEGVVIFELRTVPSIESGMHSVEGNIVIRDGAYVTDNDVRMRLHGIYVSDLNRLNAILEPLPPIRVDITEQDRTDGNAYYRQALREAAKDFNAPTGRRQAGLSLTESFQRPKGKEISSPQLRLRKKCEFHLELRPALLPGIEPSQQHRPPPIASSAMTVPVSLVGPWLSQSNPKRDHLQGDQDMEAAVHRAVAELLMNGTLVSNNCGMVLDINATYVRLEEYYAKAVNYTLMITIVSFLQVLLLIRQMESTSTQASAAKVSLLSIGIQAIMDAYLCLLHLTAGIVVEALFNAFATAAFFEFVIFAIFEMRYLLSIWRARRQSSNDGNLGSRQELSILYTRFYGALLLVIFFAYQLQHYMRSIIFLLFSFWIPQIIHCAREDVVQPLKPLYILGVSMTRLALPLYLFGCPKNMLRIATSPALCAALIGWVGFQMIILLMQTQFGPRCFIPKRFLPPKYDYFHPATPFGDGEECSGDEEMGEGSVECVICMGPVEVNRPDARMVTPCNHFFHTECLQRWMDIKMECPTCRRNLPTL